MTHLIALPGRAVIEVGGDDRVAFLQGLVSNDVAEAVPGRAVWAALLTPQGKYLADFFLLAEGARLLLDAEREQVPMLLQRLARFRLRSKVTLRAADELSVYAAWGEQPGEIAAADGSMPEALPEGTIVAPDPRLAQAGWRVLAATPLRVNAGAADWDRHRLALGLPDGTRDLEPDKTVLLEAGFDELHGVSWSKGCYMGQELTARTKYRGLLKRRLVPVSADGPLPPPGTPVQRDGVEVGVMRSGCGELGLAVLRLEAFEAPLTSGGVPLTVRMPDWMRLTEQAE